MKKIIKTLLILIGVISISACSNTNKGSSLDCSLNKYEKNPIATIKIKDYGTMEYELLINKAPQSVTIFSELANAKFYDGLNFHRLDDSQGILQGGDLEGIGSGGTGYSIEGEFLDNKHCHDTKNDEGTLAMGRIRDPNSGGSPFYLNYKNNTRAFGDGYAVFGKIKKGQDIISKISKVETTPDANGMSKPEKDLVIESIRVNTMDQEMPELNKIK